MTNSFDQIKEELLPEVQKMIREAVSRGIWTRVENHHHYNVSITFPKPLEIVMRNPATVPSKAVKTILKFSSTGGSNMNISVDTANETATIEFVDDKGNKTDAPANASVTFTSDNAAVATITTDPANPLQGNISPTGVGTVMIGATIGGATGPDGTTPLPNPDPVALTVNPGAAVGERLTVGEAPAAPTPTPEPTPTPSPTPGTELTKTAYTTTEDPATVDANAWPASGFVTQEATPRTLYYYSGDTAPNDQNGSGIPGWDVYVGPVTAVS